MAYANPQKRRTDLRRRYGLTPEEYDEMVQRNNGRCWLCMARPKAGRQLQVDHDHDTGAVRGLLCKDCNVALGVLGDNPIFLRRALCYVETGDGSCELCPDDRVGESEDLWDVDNDYEHFWTEGTRAAGRATPPSS